MMDLKRLFKNHFDTKEISDDNLRKFAEVHLQRLSANNGTAQFTAMITATTTAYTNYFGAITNEDTKFAIQQGLTVTMNNIVENFKSFASKKEGLVFGNYGKESPEYQEFYPNGVSEYRQATLANIETLMSRFFAAAERHQAELGAGLQSDAENFLTDFKNARTAQLAKIGEVQAQKSTTSTNRDGIENELMKNVHLIASMFIGNVDRCMDFFDQSFIRGSETDEEEEPPTPPVG
jgi:hypothetical protein